MSIAALPLILLVPTTAAARPLARHLSITGLAVFLALSMTATGCKDEKQLTTPLEGHDGPYGPNSSAANVLTNMQMAYAERNIDRYRSLFSEDFVFVFDPADPIDPNHPTPPHWNLVDELAATGNMFKDEFVSRIELSSYVLGLPERADSLLYGPRTWKVRVSEANLQVYMKKEDGTSLTLLVEGTTEVFFFRREPTAPAWDGKPTWFIFRWEDQPITGGKVQQTSWGQIKAAFR